MYIGGHDLTADIRDGLREQLISHSPPATANRSKRCPRSDAGCAARVAVKQSHSNFPAGAKPC
jgi:hypothetical protein